MSGTEVLARDGHLRVELSREEDAAFANPRDMDQLGIMLCFNHRTYILGDAPDWKRKSLPEYDDAERAALHFFDRHPMGKAADLFTRWAKAFLGATVVLPITLTDHSGLAVHAGRGGSTGNRGWDRGLLGFVFDSPRTREYTGAPLDTIADGLAGEVEEYNTWLSGDVWTYDVIDETGDQETESLNGLLGREYAEQAAREALALAVAHRDTHPPFPLPGSKWAFRERFPGNIVVASMYYNEDENLGTFLLLNPQSPYYTVVTGNYVTDEIEWACSHDNIVPAVNGGHETVTAGDSQPVSVPLHNGYIDRKAI